MYRHARRKDSNQRAIEKACLKIGATILDISDKGQGAPDLLVGFRGVNYLFEIKANIKKKLTPDEITFARTWQGKVTTIYTVIDAISILTIGF